MATRGERMPAERQQCTSPTRTTPTHRPGSMASAIRRYRIVSTADECRRAVGRRATAPCRIARSCRQTEATRADRQTAEFVVRQGYRRYRSGYVCAGNEKQMINRGLQRTDARRLAKVIDTSTRPDSVLIAIESQIACGRSRRRIRAWAGPRPSSEATRPLAPGLFTGGINHARPYRRGAQVKPPVDDADRARPQRLATGVK